MWGSAAWPAASFQIDARSELCRFREASSASAARLSRSMASKSCLIRYMASYTSFRGSEASSSRASVGPVSSLQLIVPTKRRSSSTRCSIPVAFTDRPAVGPVADRAVPAPCCKVATALRMAVS